MAGTSNANLVNQAQGTTGGTGATGAPLTPANDISQVDPSYMMYFSGGLPGMPEQQGYGLHGTSGRNTATTATNQVSVSQWLNTFYTTISTNPTLLQQFSTEAQLAQLVGPNANISQLYSAWQKLIVQAYNHDINGQNITPWDVLGNSIPGSAIGSYKNNSGYQAMTSMTSQQAADLAAKAAQKNKDVTTQSTTTDINYTDPDTARYVLNQASQILLGRQATNAEASSFTKQLNQNEAMFPKM